MPCNVCGLDRFLCDRQDCPFFADLAATTPRFALPTIPIVLPVPWYLQPTFQLSLLPVSDKAPEEEWYSDDVMNLLFKHYVAQAGNPVSVPAVLGSRSALGINFLETYCWGPISATGRRRGRGPQAGSRRTPRGSHGPRPRRPPTSRSRGR